MAFFGDLGKALGLGSTSDVAKFAANAAASYATGGVVPIQTSPFEQEEPQVMNPFEQQSRNMRMQSFNQSASPVREASFLGGLGQTIGGFGRDVGGFFQDISPLTNLFGFGAPSPSSVSGAARTIQRMGPEETATSGQIMGANLGLGSNLIQAATRFARSPAGGSAIGFGGGALGAALMGGGDGKVRITRRMKSDVRKIYMMAGMDPNATAQILNNLGTYPRMNFDASLVFFILTKRFRNDGPVVTKAAVRKTKTTLRRMKGVVDMYNSVCKPTTRRAPMRRAAPKAVQLIKN
tara:strand:- start:309 stop:1187 length:879 start_codon:yes stop_codon:yes gene_type:complete